MLHCHSVNHDNAPLSVREILSFTQGDPIAWLKVKAGQGMGNLFSTLTRDLFGLEDAP